MLSFFYLLLLPYFSHGGEHLLWKTVFHLFSVAFCLGISFYLLFSLRFAFSVLYVRFRQSGMPLRYHRKRLLYPTELLWYLMDCMDKTSVIDHHHRNRSYTFSFHIFIVG